MESENKPIAVMIPKKRSVIKKMDDGKGIGRRVNQNPHHPKELRQRRQGKGSPCSTALLSTPSFRRKFVTREIDKAGATTFRRKAYGFRSRNREFSSGLDTVLFVIFSLVFFL